jgi:hypothetical protein
MLIIVEHRNCPDFLIDDFCNLFYASARFENTLYAFGCKDKQKIAIKKIF